MSEHTLSRKITVDGERPLVFDFFSDAANLETITPPELNFHIFTKLPIDIREGSLIDYRLRIRGFPVNWRTEITLWDPPFEFIDEQLKGPYKQWIHRHTFIEVGDGRTQIEDEVKYRLPFEPFGDLVHCLVRRELKRIFDFREAAVRKALEVQK